MPILNSFYGGGSSGGGGNIGEPLNLTVTSAGLDATIKWEDNEIGTIPPTSFAKSELVRKVGSAPTSPSDGTLVVTETVKDTYKVSGYVDQGLTDGTTYYYRVFSYSDLGGISYCDAVSVTPSGGGWQPTSPMCWYKFDGDYTDSTSLFGDATGTATFQTLSSGIQVLQTDGTNIVDLPSGITANSLTTWTIACWVKPLANGYFAGVNNQNYYYDMSMFMSTAGRCYAEGGWGNSLHSVATIDKTDASLSNDWRLFILKSDGTTIYMNINGQAFDNITPNNTEIFWGGDSFGVGGRSSNGQPCATLMSNLVISNTYWDDATCLAMCNQTKANYGL